MFSLTPASTARTIPFRVFCRSAWHVAFSFAILLFALNTPLSAQVPDESTLLPSNAQSPFVTDPRVLDRVIEANRLYQNADYDTAQYQHCLTLFEDLLTTLDDVYPCDTTTHGDYLKGTITLAAAYCYDWLGHSTLAVAYAQRGVTVLSPFDKDSPHIVRHLDTYAAILRRAGNTRKATEMLQLALDVAEYCYSQEYYPSSHPAIVSLYLELGRIAIANKEPALGLAHFSEALSHSRRSVTPPLTSHITPRPESLYMYSIVLGELARLAISQSDFVLASKHLNEKLSLLRSPRYSTQVTTAPDQLLDTLRTLAGVHGQLSDYDAAQTRIKEALHILDAHPTRQSLKQFRFICYLDLAHFSQLSEDLGSAQTYITKAIVELPAANFDASDEQAAHASLRHRRGSMLAQIGQLEKGLADLQFASAIRRTISASTGRPSDLRNLALSLGEESKALLGLGDAHKADVAATEVVEIYKALFPESTHPDGSEELAKALQNRGVILRETGRFQDALVSFADSLRMRERSTWRPKNAPDLGLAQLLQLISDLHVATGDHRKAQYDLERSHNIIQSAYPHDRYPNGHEALLLSLIRLSRLEVYKGEAARSMAHSTEAVAMASHLYPASLYPYGHEIFARALDVHATALHLQHEYAESYNSASRAANMRLELARSIIRGLSEGEALNYVTVTHVMPSALFSSWPRSGIGVEELYRIIWNRRSLVLRTLADLRREAYVSVSTETRDKAVELRAVCRELAGTYHVSQVGLESEDSISERIRVLSDKRESLEKALISQIASRHVDLTTRSFAPKSLLESLGDNQCYIEFVIHPLIDAVTLRSVNYYSAFIVAPRQPITYVQIADVASIDEAVEQFRADIISDNDWRTSGTIIRSTVWERLQAAIPSRCSTIFLCLDGNLSRLPWSAIPIDDERVLLSKYAFAAVPCGHNLCEWLQQPRRNASDRIALAVGDVDFETSVAIPDGVRVIATQDRKKSNVTFTALPETKREIVQLMNQAQDWKVVSLTGSKAVASRVLEELRNARLAHFATHGYFGGPDARRVTYGKLTPDQYFQPRVSPLARSPLLLSGLVLSGGNTIPVGGSHSSVSEATLSAEVVATLQFPNLTLVVLSACDTGLGDIAGNEGVYGLQRAFHMAGARNVLGTLWKVDDGRTVDFMEVFYRHYLGYHQDPLVAVRAAQLEIFRQSSAHANRIGTKRGRIDFGADKDNSQSLNTSLLNQPKYWAAFMLSGPGS